MAINTIKVGNGTSTSYNTGDVIYDDTTGTISICTNSNTSLNTVLTTTGNTFTTTLAKTKIKFLGHELTMDSSMYYGYSMSTTTLLFTLENYCLCGGDLKEGYERLKNNYMQSFSDDIEAQLYKIMDIERRKKNIKDILNG